MKIAMKTGAMLLPLFLLTATGCQSADPASRSNNAEYDSLVSDVCVRDKSTLTINLTIGDGLVASADGGGDKTDSSPTQTTDTKPEAVFAWGGSSAGTGGEQRADAVSGLKKLLDGINAGRAPTLTDAERKAVNDCAECSPCSE